MTTRRISRDITDGTGGDPLGKPGPRSHAEPAGTVATRVVQARVPVASVEALSLRARQLGITVQELAGQLVAHGLSSPALRP